MPLLLIPLLGVLLKLLLVRLIIATGLTFVTYTGYLLALGKFKDYVIKAINTMPADVLNLLLIAGVGEGVGILFGAFTFTIVMKGLSKLSFLIEKAQL